MTRIFNRVITFHIEGEIYDKKTTPESIINNYNWSYRDNLDDKIQIMATHKDSRGRITKVIYLPKIHPWHKKDAELFLV